MLSYTPGTILYRSKPYAMLSERLQTTLHSQQNLMQCCVILLGQHCTRKTLCNVAQGTPDNIAQVKVLCNVAREAPDNAPDNIAQEKIQCNVVLILLRQHCTGQNPMQCCLRGSRQCCTGKILCNVVLILPGQQCTGKTLGIVFQGTPDNIAQEKIKAILSEQHLVTPFIYIYARSFTSQKNMKIYLL